jgi:hypothetical protein
MHPLKFHISLLLKVLWKNLSQDKLAATGFYETNKQPIYNLFSLTEIDQSS